MKKLCMVGVWTLLALLVGCGGGNKSSTTSSSSSSSSSSTTTSGVAYVELEGSAASMGSASGSVTLTARVLDASRNALEGKSVAFSTDSGTLVVASATSAADGTATATLNVGADRSNRAITARATSSTISASRSVQVTGSNLALTGSTSLQQGSAQSFSVLLKDSGGNAIANTALTLSSLSLSNGLSATTVQTDYTGSASFTYTPTNAGTDTLRVAGAGVTLDTALTVTAQDFVVLSPAANATINVGANQTVQVQYSGANPGSYTVNFSTTRGNVSPTSQTLDGAGLASTTLSSSTSGSAVVQAVLTNGSTTKTVTLPVVFTATTPAAVAVQANPTALAPNTGGSTANRSTIQAVVRDASGNLVANKTVNFTITSGTGTLTAASSSTDAEGKAQVQYIAGSTPTAQNGVVVTATVEGTAVSSSASLTVNGQSLFINFYTGNSMESFDTNTYRMPVTVSVTDASGVAVATQAVGFALWARSYDKGTLSWNATAGAWTVAASASGCPNEDANKNGILDSGEDLNGDNKLWPGAPASLQSGSVTTDSNGLATVYVLFGKNYARWVRVDLTATVSVTGSESSRIYSFTLPILEDDRTKETPPPASEISPLGVASVCTSAL
ncbi:MAG: Ig-like domain-containing protein [Rhodoferax sp.]